MKLSCPWCRRPVPAGDVDLSTGLARCGGCGTVFRFDTAPEVAPAPPRRPRALAEQPASVQVREEPGGVAFTCRWFWWKYVAVAPFALGWDAGMWEWYRDVLRDGNVAMARVMAVFGIGHAAIAIALTYAIIAGFVNATTLRISRGWLSVRHHPLPWAGGLRIPAEAIAQLCVVQRTRRGWAMSYGYDLVALLRDGSRRRIMASIDHAGVALFLEERAEAWMGIADQPVEGELAGR